jgi:mono/diheme cytochrome c family protein
MAMKPVIAGVVLSLGFGLAASGAAQQTGRDAPSAEPPVLSDSLNGPDLFRVYCAPCHGRDGKGAGPVALALKARPPDLMEIARRNRGVFPKARVEAFVTNGSASAKSAHGSVEMPVWGPTFRSLDPSDARVRVRIGNIVDYIEKIQTEVMIVSGSLAHHRLTDDLFRIDELWMQLTPNTEFYRWLSQGIDRNASIILTPHPDRFADVKGVRILTGTMIHDTAPSASPIVHTMFLKDLTTGALAPITFETTDPNVAKTFDFYDNVDVSVVIQIQIK